MSQPERSKFNATIITAGWTAPPEPLLQAPHRERIKAAIESSGPPSTSLAVRPEPVRVLSTRAWSSPVTVVEDVDLPHSPDARLFLLREPSSAQSRSFRLLQHRLIARSDPRVIVVTSARPKEGKTTCAANLALALSEQTSARVLLIEANSRRPELARLFDLKVTDHFINGFFEHRHIESPFAVAAVRGRELHVAALRRDAAVNGRLDRALLGSAVGTLRHVYDYIVIDAASVLESADADVAGECADGVIVAARAAKSRKSELRRTIDQLYPARVLGLVLLET